MQIFKNYEFSDTLWNQLVFRNKLDILSDFEDLIQSWWHGNILVQWNYHEISLGDMRI